MLSSTPKSSDSTRKLISIVGSGPNGLAAAITMAEAGYRVQIFEAADSAGGGTRSQPLTLPGFQHDLCSAAHPLAISSPFFRERNFEKYGLRWILPPASLTHPFGIENDKTIEVYRSVEETAALLREDESAYLGVMRPLIEHWDALVQEVLQPALHVPRSPWLLMRFGFMAMMSATRFVETYFRGEAAKALFMGTAAHVNAPLDQAGTAAIALILLGAAHTRGWPIPEGGSQSIASAMVAYFESLGGEIHLNHKIDSIHDLPPSEAYLFDIVPSKLIPILGGVFPTDRYRDFQHGPGVFKMDWALSRPIPWRQPGTARAATVHIGGSWQEIVQSERQPIAGQHPEAPYVLLTQPTLFDSTRAPAGQHIAWGYCHVPNGSRESMVEAIENQIERYAPGFRDSILMRHSLDTAAMEAKNGNLVGGDIAGGQFSLRNLLFPGSISRDPYRIGERCFICSSSTPPGPGVHGMSGFHAARSALKALGR